jgi:hypothetical protein
VSDSLFKLLASRESPSSASEEKEVDSLADDFGVFGYLRGVRDRALMLELRRKMATWWRSAIHGWSESSLIPQRASPCDSPARLLRSSAATSAWKCNRTYVCLQDL